MATLRRFQFNPYLMRWSDTETMRLLEGLDGSVCEVFNHSGIELYNRSSDYAIDTASMTWIRIDLADGSAFVGWVHNSELVPVDEEFNYHGDTTSPPTA